MDPVSLKVFKAVVEEGGVVAAARKLHRVQSNVTTRIKKLESSLGAELFIRDKRSLRLSPAGRIFLGYAEQLLRISDQARSAVLGGTPQGVLSVGTLESTAASRLPSLLSRFHRKFPRVQVELTTGTTDALIEAVERGTIDAAFVADCPNASDLDSRPAFDEEIVVIAPRLHPAITRARDVRANTIISFPVGCAYRRLLQAWLATGGVVPARIMELGSYHAIVACVASGTGIAVVPRSVLNITRTGDNIGVYPLDGKRGQVQTSLVWRRGDVSPALASLEREIGVLAISAKRK